MKPTTSLILMFALLAQYIILVFVHIAEGNWKKVMYWVGVTIISFSILLME